MTSTILEAAPLRANYYLQNYWTNVHQTLSVISI